MFASVSRIPTLFFFAVHGLIVSHQMVLLAKLLPRLQAEGHKVLIFSQMVRVLDLIEVRSYASFSRRGSCSSDTYRVHSCLASFSSFFFQHLNLCFSC